MLLTYQTYLLSIETVDINLNSNLDTKSESESESESGPGSVSGDWDQYFDIESQKIINSKNKNHHILKHYIQYRQAPANKLFKRKKQNQSSNIKILETIKEDEMEILEDIETGKIYKNEANTKVYLYLINLQNIITASLIYIFHLALIVFLIRI